MRKRAVQKGLTVQAVAGNHAVFFGFDLTDEARAKCLGISIYRIDHTENEAYWLAGFKTFRSVVPAPKPMDQYTTDKHPVQSMQWGDYTAKPAHRYTYKIVPLYGTPHDLTAQDGVSVELNLTTNNPEEGKHGVYFNRGVAASQAYAVKFGDTPPKLSPAKKSEAMAWLSRGLQEALCQFISNDASDRVSIRAAVYEFTDPSVLHAFMSAKAAGADVRIVYHSKGPEGESNNKAINELGFDRSMLIARDHATIAHNKFIVRCVSESSVSSPIANEVWTGSTNLSQGGIFGHSNVGHAVRDHQVANSYLKFWTELAKNPALKPLKGWVSANSPFDEAALTAPGIHTLFSPRIELDPLDWYARKFTSASVSTYITLPFGMDNKYFEPALERCAPSDQALRFITLNKADDHQDAWASRLAVQVAVGAEGSTDLLSRWAKETLTGFNSAVDYLHTKILLVAPLSLAPMTISGSANFSESSTTANDENMLIVTGDREVADVYFTEYLRIFQHFYARWWAARLASHKSDDRNFLAENASWQNRYWHASGVKRVEREFYANGVEGNQ